MAIALTVTILGRWQVQPYPAWWGSRSQSRRVRAAQPPPGLLCDFVPSTRPLW